MSIRRIRNTVSNALAERLVQIQKSRIARGDLPAVPLEVWHLLPDGVKEWFGRRVLKPAQEFAWSQLGLNTQLSPIAHRENYVWALSPSSRLYLWRRVLRQKPLRIIEFGSGQSTLLFALYAAEMAAHGRDVQICSIEHDGAWVREMNGRLRSLGLEKSVTLIEAPLIAQQLLGREMTAYSVSCDTLADFCDGGGFDFCLIDGPPATAGRAGSLALVANHLCCGATILLDDAFRPDELAVVREWRQAWPNALSRPRLLIADFHGLAEMRWLSRAAGASLRPVDSSRPE